MTEVPIPDRTQQLVDALIGQTLAGRRSWELGSAETEFVFTEEAGTVIISSIDGDGTVPFELRVLDPSGSLVERYTSENEGSAAFRPLYEAALRSTVKASDVVESLYENLTRRPSDDIPF